MNESGIAESQGETTENGVLHIETLTIFRKRKNRRIWEESSFCYMTYFLEEYLPGFMPTKIKPFHSVKTCAVEV